MPAGIVREYLHLRRMKMKRNVFVIGFISLALITTMFLTNCEEPEPEKKYGSLTVKNLPNVTPVLVYGVQVYWFCTVYFNEEITNSNQLHNLVTGDNEVTVSPYPDKDFDKSTSTFRLLDSHTYDEFNKTGNYLVSIVRPNEVSTSWTRYYISNVHFTKGKATIDFEDMSSFRD
jgi:hypothetical protein